jgi:hypothetical protein
MIKKLALILIPRIPALAAITLISILLAVGTHVRGTLPAAWEAFGIVSNTLSFEDLRGVTHSIDCVNAGQDPYSVRSFDPWHRLYNYPPIWLGLGHLGVTSRTTNLIGVGLALVTIAALLTLFTASNWISRMVVFLALLGWPMLFAIERGNVDLVVFSASIFGFLWLQELREPYRHVGRAVLIVSLTILKIYPIAMVTVFVRGSRGWLRAGTVAIICAIALLLTCGHRLHAVLTNTPQVTNWRSFGSYVLAAFLQRHLFPNPSSQITAHLHRIGSVTAALVGASAAAYGALKQQQVSKILPSLDVRTGTGAIAVAGLSVYCFVFVMGANFDYRLIFLLAPLGWLVRDLSSANSLRALPVSILLVTYLLSFYLDRLAVSEMFEPIVFILASGWLGCSLLPRSIPKLKRVRFGLHVTSITSA